MIAPTTMCVAFANNTRSARILASGPQRAREIADRRFGVGNWILAILSPLSGEPTEEIVDLQGYVVCDLCGDDYSMSDEAGGIIIETYSICPRCTPRAQDGARRFGRPEPVRARAMPGEPFRAFVERMRDGDDFASFALEE
jgi:hypothetical protein